MAVNEKQLSDYVIVWDLDNTLGHFAELEGRGDSDESVTAQLRPDIAIALADLKSMGFQHVLLTLASQHYAELALRGTGIRDLFSVVQGRDQRPKGDVAGIAALFQISDNAQGDKMLFVGDHPIHDRPQNPNVVFHFEPHALNRSAILVVELIEALLVAGKGSIREGFAQLARENLTVLGRVQSYLKSKRSRLDHFTLASGKSVYLATHDDGGATVAFADELQDSCEPDYYKFIPSNIRIVPSEM